VLEDIAFSADVTFQKDAAGESTVVGQFVNESGVARGIGRIHGGRVYAYQADSHERAQQRGRQDIAHLVDQLGVRPREETIESSHRLYKLALQRGFTRGRRTNQVAAACLYLVCRQDAKPFLLIDFSDTLQVNVFTLGAVFLQLAKLLRLEEHPLFSKPVDPSLYIHRFADRMEFPDRDIMRVVSATAIRLVASMKRDWIQTGRRPSGVCGAALYIASHLHGFAKAKRDVVNVVHIGEHTLAKRLTEFSSTEAGALTRSEFEAHDELLKKREQEALESAPSSAAPTGSLAGCEHLAMGIDHFQQGMCKQCFIDFVEHTGGTYDGANPPAYLKNRQQESKKAATLSEATALLALPAPVGDGSADKEQKGGDDVDEEAVSARGNRGTKSKIAGKGKAKKGLSKGSQEQPSSGAEPSRYSRGRGAAAEDEDVEEDAGAGPSSAAGATAAMEKLTTAMIEAAEKEVEGFDIAIAEAEAQDAKKTAKRRKTMSTAAAVAAATAAAVREAAHDAGAEEEDAEAAAGAMVPSSAAAAGVPGGGIATRQSNLSLGVAPSTTTAPAATAEEEEEPEEEDDGNLSEISDGDIEMYLADEAEVACKEEIWHLMNQDWVEKQAAKRAAMEAAERAQEEQRAAMEAAAAAGIQYKRGRGRPLGSKTRPKPETNLPPAETPQEAAMRMLDTKKLSSKINYTALADLFSDEPAGGEGQDFEKEDDVEEDDEDSSGDGAGPSNTHGSGDGSGPSTSKAAAAAAGAPIQRNQGPAEEGNPDKMKSSSLPGSSHGSGGLKRPASRIAGMAPRAAGRLGGLSNGAAGGAGRLGGLHESLAARPLGTPLGNTTQGGIGSGTGSALTAKKSNTKVRFKPGTKKD
jgi:transcription factor IIIB subunit 2